MQGPGPLQLPPGRRRFAWDAITVSTASAISTRSGNGTRRHNRMATSRSRRRLRNMVKSGRAATERNIMRLVQAIEPADIRVTGVTRW